MCRRQTTNMCGARSNFIALPLIPQRASLFSPCLTKSFQTETGLVSMKDFAFTAVSHLKSYPFCQLCAANAWVCHRNAYQQHGYLNKKKNSSVRKTKISLGWGNIWTSSNCDWWETSLNTLLKAMLLQSLSISPVWSVKLFFVTFFMLGNFFFFFFLLQNQFVLFSVISIWSSTISHSTLALSQPNLNQYISTSSRRRTSWIDASTNKIQNPSKKRDWSLSQHNTFQSAIIFVVQTLILISELAWVRGK